VQVFIEILTNVTLPIVALVAIGWVFQRRLKIDVASLNRLQVHVILPCFFIITLSTSKQPLSAVWPTAVFMFIQLLMLVPLGWLIAMAVRMKPETGPVVGLGVAYANVGYFGVPVALLAFGPDSLIHVSVMTVFMAILAVTVGVWMLAPGGGSFGSRIMTAFETPMLPSIMIGLALRALEIKLPVVLSQPMNLMGQTFTALALYSLGAQIASSSLRHVKFWPQLLMIVLKFGMAPALSWALAAYLQLPTDLIKLLVVMTATPVGVIITIYCIEYNRDPEFISAAVVLSTIVSPLFVTGWILLMQFTY
jgi:hypothetical protein